MEQLQELFVLPENPRLAIKVEGIPLYTSDRMQERFIKALSKTGYLSGLIREIDIIVRKKQDIVPCWQEKSAIKFIARKILNSIDDPGFVAIYIPETKKIYIVLDIYINWFLSYSNRVLERIVIHELVHYCRHRNPNKFLSIFKDHLMDFYILFLKDIFKISKQQNIDNEIWKIIIQLVKMKQIENLTLGSLLKIYQKIMEPLRKYSKDPELFDKVLEDLKQCIILQQTEEDPGYKILYNKYKYILDSLFKTYDSLDIPSFAFTPGQELWTPDEVISIYVEKKILKDKFTTLVKSSV